MKRPAVQDLSAPGWIQVIALLCSWQAIKRDDDVLGFVDGAYKVQRCLRTLLEGLLALRIKADSSLLEEAKIEIPDIWPGRTPDQMGVVLMLLSSASRSRRAELTQALGKDLIQALGALRDEAYARMPGKDLVHEARARRDARPAWMGPDLPVDPLRAALIRAGRKHQVWVKLGSARGELLEIPDVPPTDPVVSGRITVEGIIVQLNDADRTLKIAGSCKDSPVAHELTVMGRFFDCEVPETGLYDTLRRAAPGKAHVFELDVLDSIVDGGELRRRYRIVKADAAR